MKGLGFDAGRLAWRVYVPIIHHGVTVSWVARAIGEQNHPKYVAAAPDQEVVPSKSVLFGADYARAAVVVVEGVFDAMRIGPGAVATMGVGVTRAQLRAISRYPVRAVCLDTDEAGRGRGRELANELSAMPGATHLVTLDAHDPAEASAAEVKAIRRAFLE